MQSKNGRPCKTQSPFTDIFRGLIINETQQEVANRVGVSRQNVGKWLSGETTPDINTLGKIADAYGVSTDYLLGRTSVKSTDIELKAVCEYIGLSENAVMKIRSAINKDVKSSVLYEGIIVDILDYIEKLKGETK